jgi:hypothetical protein
LDKVAKCSTVAFSLSLWSRPQWKVDNRSFKHSVDPFHDAEKNGVRPSRSLSTISLHQIPK